MLYDICGVKGLDIMYACAKILLSSLHARQPSNNPNNNRHTRQPDHHRPKQRHAQTTQRRRPRITHQQQRRCNRTAVPAQRHTPSHIIVLRDPHPLQQRRPDKHAHDATHDAQHGHELQVAPEVLRRRRREGEGQGAGREGEGAGGRDAEGAAEGRVAEEGARGDEDVGEDDAGEVPLELESVLEHWEGEGDDGDVEDGAENVACARWGQVRTVAVEELDVARFGAVG